MRIAIIGGGAAGLMAAAAAHDTNPAAEVVLVEKNNGLGKKVIISGGGRCNVTTGLRDIRAVLARYPRGGKFLNSAMRRFPPEAVYDWFEAYGVPLKVEEDLRVFPQSNDGHDIVGAFERLFARSRVQVLLSRSVTGVTREGDGFVVAFRDAEPLRVDRVIITTGGQAFRHTGSTGDGYAFAESLGHRVTALAPSLNSFVTSERWPQEVSGLSFGRALLRTSFAKPYEFAGPMLFTHRGISGPAVFALSSLVAFERYNEVHPMEVLVDIFPDVSDEALRERLSALTWSAASSRSIPRRTPPRCPRRTSSASWPGSRASRSMPSDAGWETSS
jgi:predicted Rossmann fold flavoprotein